jgi:hypothetical protein
MDIDQRSIPHVAWVGHPATIIRGLKKLIKLIAHRLRPVPDFALVRRVRLAVLPHKMAVRREGIGVALRCAALASFNLNAAVHPTHQLTFDCTEIHGRVNHLAVPLPLRRVDGLQEWCGKVMQSDLA